MINLVHQFHQKFGLPTGEFDRLTTDIDAMQFRISFLVEELCELAKALAARNQVEAFDALLDLVYVAHGTALFMGIDQDQWYAGMCAVHEANMAKVRVARPSESKRGSGWDVRKPEGWIGPEAHLQEILRWAK